MKGLVKSAVRRASRVAMLEGSLRRPRGDSFDVLDVAFLTAAMDSASFYEQHMLTSTAFDTDLALLTHALEMAPHDGLVLEFGVASGRTIRHLAGASARPMHGFDSFEGLPESWRTGFGQGAFRQALPSVPRNVTLHKGWFSDILPPFLNSETGRVALLHVDCDLYSSTEVVLRALADRISIGTVIVFDEYFNYPGWRQHEYKAFAEFVAATGVEFRFDSFVPSHQQVCVRITRDPRSG